MASGERGGPGEDGAPAYGLASAGVVRRALIIVSSVCLVCAFAVVQFRVNLGVPIAPRHFVIPSTVGAIFGVLLTMVLELRERVARYAEELARRVVVTGSQIE